MGKDKDFTLKIEVQPGTKEISVTLKDIYTKLEDVGEVKVVQTGADQNTDHHIDEELRENYCFWCGTHGVNQADCCYNCGYEIGSYPPEIKALIAQEVEAARPTQIMGKSVEEIMVILSALELERITDMEMTMGKLDEWMKLVREDYRKAMEKATEAAISSVITNSNKGDTK
jgi:hypothetical protein